MDIDEIIGIFDENELFSVYEVSYKAQKDKDKYGKSFDASLKSKDYVYICVNKGTFKAKRVIEEFGCIIFIYDGNQISWKTEDIESIRIL